MKRTVFIVSVLVTFCYVLLGAVVFHFLEGDNERTHQQYFEVEHLKFLESHTCMTPEELRDYILKVMEARAHGVSFLNIVSNVNITKHSNNSSNNSSNNTSTIGDDIASATNWDIASSFLFCLTVVSTVGYGNFAPKTEGGQMFCIVFALLGIPLFATSLVGVGERLQIPLHKIKKCRPWCRLDPTKDSQLKTAVFLSTGISVLIFIPSWVLSKMEDWSFIESLYFCIITLTTIGFGDYVPGQLSHDHSFYLHRIVLAVWILLGLSWIALIFSEFATVMQEKLLEAAKRTSDTLGDLEDKVKKKAKDAREKIVQKASMPQWRRRYTREKVRKGAELEDAIVNQFEVVHKKVPKHSPKRDKENTTSDKTNGRYDSLSKTHEESYDTEHEKGSGDANDASQNNVFDEEDNGVHVDISRVDI